MTLLPMSSPAGLFPDPGTARDWLDRELSRPEYKESLLDRFARWFNGVMDGVRSVTGGSMNPVLAMVLLLLLAAGLALVLSRLRPNPTSAQETALFSEPRESAEEHRRHAREALAGQRWGEAVVEAVRALAVELVERGLAPEQAGVTVHEIGARAGALFPACTTRLEAMARLFDETRYGDRPADEEQARSVVALEQELRERSPGHADPATSLNAVPR